MAPTESSEKPMDVTTTAATIGVMIRRQVRHEHGQDVLDAIGHRAQNRYVAVEFQQLIVVEQLQMRAHRRNSISPVSGSMACTMASDSR